MKVRQWGEDVWEEKARTQSGVGVVSGTNASKMDVKRKVEDFFKMFDNSIKSFIPKNGSVLDCGVGPLATHYIGLSKRGYNVMGVDISKTTLQLAKENIEKANLKANLSKDNIVDLKNIKGTFDLVICIGTFGHIPAYLSLETLRAFNRKTKKKGYVLVHFWIEKEKNFLEKINNLVYRHVRLIKKILGLKTFNVNCSLYSREEIKDLCQRSGFEIVKVISDMYLLRKN